MPEVETDVSVGCDAPSVSVVLCTYNRSDLLRRALLSFRGLAGCGGCELIVVDNNSTDDTPDVVSACVDEIGDHVTVRYIHEPVQGLSVARNRGIAAARGDIIAFLDDDAVPGQRWLVGMRELFAARPEVLAAGGPIEPEFEIQRPDWLVTPLEPYYTILDLGDKLMEFPRGREPFGAGMAFRAAMLRQHGFNKTLGRKGDQLLSNEESQLFHQIRAAGGQLFYVPDMGVRHFVPKERLTKDWITRRCYYSGLSKALIRRGPVATPCLLTEYLAKWLYLQFRKRAPIMQFSLLDECRLRIANGVFSGSVLRNRNIV